MQRSTFSTKYCLYVQIQLIPKVPFASWISQNYKACTFVFTPFQLHSFIPSPALFFFFFLTFSLSAWCNSSSRSMSLVYRLDSLHIRCLYGSTFCSTIWFEVTLFRRMVFCLSSWSYLTTEYQMPGFFFSFQQECVILSVPDLLEFLSGIA